jgi:hypothetical protein
MRAALPGRTHDRNWPHLHARENSCEPGAIHTCQHARQDPWVARLLASKPRKVVAVALANKLARIGWALMTRQEDFRSPLAAA